MVKSWLLASEFPITLGFDAKTDIGLTRFALYSTYIPPAFLLVDIAYYPRRTSMGYSALSTGGLVLGSRSGRADYRAVPRSEINVTLSDSPNSARGIGRKGERECQECIYIAASPLCYVVSED